MDGLAENTSRAYAVENDFIFSTYFFALIDAWKNEISNNTLITTLYDIISDPIGLKNRNGDPIVCSPSNASRIKRRRENMDRLIIAHRNDKNVNKHIVRDFELLIVPRLQKSKMNNFVANLITAIEGPRCTETVIGHLAELSKEIPPTKFLARALQESLSCPNSLRKKTKPMLQDEAFTTFRIYRKRAFSEKSIKKRKTKYLMSKHLSESTIKKKMLTSLQRTEPIHCFGIKGIFQMKSQ